MSWASIGMLHPSALPGKWEQAPLQITYFERAKDYVRSIFEPVDLSQLPENALSYPTVDEIEQFFSRANQHGYNAAQRLGYAIDIEAAGTHIICIGFTRIGSGEYICVRFRCRGGALYFANYSDLYRVVEVLDDVLGDETVAKVFHNGQAYDGPELIQMAFADGKWNGFNLRGFYDHEFGIDTMLVQMTALSGFPKGLQFCATHWLGFPNWKKLVSEDDEVAEGKS